MVCPARISSFPCVHSSLMYFFLPLISIGDSSSTSALGRRWDRSSDCSNSERSRRRPEALREGEGVSARGKDEGKLPLASNILKGREIWLGDAKAYEPTSIGIMRQPKQFEATLALAISSTCSGRDEFLVLYGIVCAKETKFE
jgi:hypothetical protein